MSKLLLSFVYFLHFLFVFNFVSAFVLSNDSTESLDSNPLITDPDSNQLSDDSKKRRKRSALLSSGSTQLEGSIDPMKVYRDLYKRYDTSDDEENKQQRGECRKRRLRMCQSHTPYNSTVFPNIIGDKSEADVNQSIPFFNLLAKSGCNKRLRQLLCTFLEPPCHNGRAIPPCKKFCRVALEVWSSLNWFNLFYLWFLLGMRWIYSCNSWTLVSVWLQTIPGLDRPNRMCELSSGQFLCQRWVPLSRPDLHFQAMGNNCLIWQLIIKWKNEFIKWFIDL